MSSIVSQEALLGSLEETLPTSDATPSISVGIVPSNYCRWKTSLDRIFALFLLPLVVPAIGLTILLIRLTSKGKGIFRQVRVGIRGETYVMLKIRTMCDNAEAATGPVWTQVRDARVTPVGRFIRALHLDEFPQVFNVLRGQMSLIGPRPERPEFTQKLAGEIPGYLGRLAVRPGITGLAQINLPPDTDLDSVRRKIVLDCEYIETANAWLDLRILLCTVLRMLGIRGLIPARLLGVYREVRLCQQEPATPHSGGRALPASKRMAHPSNGSALNGSGDKSHNGHAHLQDPWAAPRLPR